MKEVAQKHHLPAAVRATRPNDTTGRLVALEAQVADMERRLAALEGRRGTSRRVRILAPRASLPALPAGLEALSEVARRHGLGPSTVYSAMRKGRFPEPIAGPWRGERPNAIIKWALDQGGRQAFYARWHTLPGFVRCQDCPDPNVLGAEHT